ncbi:hypothetical protein HMPREF0577_1906 [Mobiluncus mulieris ATCC 35243]|nr:hypothetical protein HMPREF0577_1906 [Mobiluncus mulieris ATCC 35243]
MMGSKARPTTHKAQQLKPRWKGIGIECKKAADKNRHGSNKAAAGMKAKSRISVGNNSVATQITNMARQSPQVTKDFGGFGARVFSE